MNKNQIKLAIGVVMLVLGVTADAVITRKVIKEYKRQIQELEESNDKLVSKVNELEDDAEEYNRVIDGQVQDLRKKTKDLSEVKEKLHNAVGQDINENGEWSDNEELAEMRARYNMPKRKPDLMTITPKDEKRFDEKYNQPHKGYKPNKSTNKFAEDKLKGLSPSERIRARNAAEHEREDAVTPR